MSAMLSLSSDSDPFGAVSPYLEMGAYEALWANAKTSFKSIAELVASIPNATVSEFVPHTEALRTAGEVSELFAEKGLRRFGVHHRCDASYPDRLLDAEHPVELLYFMGYWELLFTPCVAVVGTRNPSEEGRQRARKIARLLVADGFTVMSGLAKGIDTEAHTAAIAAGGTTVAVIGTSLLESYPRENAALQSCISQNHLVVSQVPVLRSKKQSWEGNRYFFPARNVTMSALSLATIIVEAGETSGTLVQAKAALKQRRKLFILDSCFKNPAITWPHKFEALGAIRVSDYEEIRRELRTQQEADENRSAACERPLVS